MHNFPQKPLELQKKYIPLDAKKAKIASGSNIWCRN